MKDKGPPPPPPPQSVHGCKKNLSYPQQQRFTQILSLLLPNYYLPSSDCHDEFCSFQGRRKNREELSDMLCLRCWQEGISFPTPGFLLQSQRSTDWRPKKGSSPLLEESGKLLLLLWGRAGCCPLSFPSGRLSSRGRREADRQAGNIGESQQWQGRVWSALGNHGMRKVQLAW